MKRIVALIGLVATLGFAGTASAQEYDVPDGVLSVNAQQIEAGGTVTISGDGFAAGSTVDIVLVVPTVANGLVSGAIFLTAAAGEAEIQLGQLTADADGSISGSVTIPVSFSGNGRLEARGLAPDGARHVLAVGITGGVASELPATGSGSSTAWALWFGAAAVGAGALLLAVRGVRIRQD